MARAESEKEKSNLGFDTPTAKIDPTSGAAKTPNNLIGKFIVAWVVLVAIGLALGITGLGKELQQAVIDAFNSGGYSGEVRNCIASNFGHAPDCAPDSGGQCLPTIINGRAPACGSLSGTGCKDVTVTGAVYNPYRYCYSVTSQGECIPCQ